MFLRALFDKMVIFIFVLTGLISTAQESPFSPWYNWERPQALMYTSQRSGFMILNNIKPTQGFDELMGRECSKSELEYRTADGSCYYSEYSLMGSKGTYFGRNLNVDDKRYEQHLSGELPSPREVSLKLFSRKGRKIRTTLDSNMLSAAFLQFNLHDWFSHEEDHQTVLDIPLAKNDPLKKYQDKMQVFAFKKFKNKNGQVAYRNMTTQWFDGSQIYGSSSEQLKEIRGLNPRGGKIQLTKKGYLPLNDKGDVLTGDVRNWWLGLELMHTLFVRNHNRIAETLNRKYGSENPEYWTDERLFQTARLINVATIAKFFTWDLLKSRFKNDNAARAAIASWKSPLHAFLGSGEINNPLENSQPWVDGASIKFWQIIDQMGIREQMSKFGILQDKPITYQVGNVGGPLRLYGKPFSMTEEWSLLYRYHSLISDSVTFRSFKSDSLYGMISPLLIDEKLDKVNIGDTVREKSRSLIKRYGFARAFEAFGREPSGTTSLKNTPEFLQKIPTFTMGRDGKLKKMYLDVVAADLLREREIGVPTYNQFRVGMGLKPVERFEQLTEDVEILESLHELYDPCGGISCLDASVGTTAEDASARGAGFELSETQFELLGFLALRRLQADPHFTVNFNEKSYTKLGLDMISEATFTQTLLANFPEIAQQNIIDPKQNAFEMW